HTVQRLLDAGFEPTEVMGALLDLWMKEFSREGEQIIEDRATPRQQSQSQQREFVPRAQSAVQGQGAAPAAEVPERPAAGTDTEAQPSQAPAPRPAAPAYEPRDDAGPAPKRARSAGPRGARSGMVRLFINVGSMDNARPGDIAGLIYNTSKIPPGAVGSIEVYEKSSFIEVPEDHVETVMSTVTGAVMRGREVRVDFADRQEAGPERERRSFGPPRKAGGFGGKPGGFKKDFSAGKGDKPGGFGKKPFGGGKKPSGGGFKPRRWDG
ncbi:MAG TPA: DbpA RNA binding domain-containing protein, partial [Prosthecobacter sp.]|nr:DbpA RNA binding domain-containing protein [Prosthecobacter sp.]